MQSMCVSCKLYIILFTRVCTMDKRKSWAEAASISSDSTNNSTSAPTTAPHIYLFYCNFLFIFASVCALFYSISGFTAYLLLCGFFGGKCTSRGNKKLHGIRKNNDDVSKEKCLRWNSSYFV